MAINILIGIGGRGIQMTEAFAYLSACGLGADETHVLLIDPDKGNGNLGRTMKLLNLYQKCRGMGYGNVPFFSPIIKGPIDEHQEYNWHWSPVKRDESLHDLIKYNMLSEDEQDLCNLLLTEDERCTKLNQGFRGHPAIGSVVMASSKIFNDYDNAEPEVLQSPIGQTMRLIKENKASDIRIFICGSIFGGTGAAGFPNLPKLILDITENRENIYIGGMIMLPYFTFSTPDKKIDGLFVKSENFISSTKAALMNYDIFIKGVYNRIYVLGEKSIKDTALGKFAVGGESQTNHPHYIEIIAALSAMAFFKDTQPLPKRSESKIEYCYCGRENNNEVTWNDMPSNSFERDEIKIKMATAAIMGTVYLYFYKNTNQFTQFPGEMKVIRDFFKKNDDLTADREKQYLAIVRDFFQREGHYSFFEWLRDTHRFDNPVVRLINTRRNVESDFSSVLFNESGLTPDYTKFIECLKKVKVESGLSSASAKLVNIFYQASYNFVQKVYNIN